MPRILQLILAACALLAGAPALAQVTPTPPAQVAGSHGVDFEYVQDRQILFPILVNGRPAEAWLDSGASATVLDAAFARELGVELLDVRVRAQGVAGRVPGVRLAGADLQVGDLALPGRQVAVMDLAAITRVVQRPVQVILGRDIFDNAVVDIDFAARQITFLPRETFEPPPGEPLPLTASGSLRSFPIAIGGIHTAAILDLGNAGALLVDRAFADGHSLLAGRRASTQLAVGADGPRESAIFSLDDVRVGGMSFNGVPTTATTGLSSRAPANVGLALLSRFHLTVDFAGDRLWMQPYPKAEAAAFRKNRAGLSLVAEGGHLMVTHVAPGSPALAAGWRIGDMILAVDGRTIGPDYGATELSRWTGQAAGRVVALTMVDGSRRLLRLADYY
ncbi:MAG: aspartyl protease family protein [Phenylobacterium sp.]